MCQPIPKTFSLRIDFALHRDTIEEWGGANLFAFVGNRPIDWIDTDGRAIFRGDEGSLADGVQNYVESEPPLKSGFDYLFSRDPKFNCVLKEDRITKTVPALVWDVELELYKIQQLASSRECIYDCTIPCWFWKDKKYEGKFGYGVSTSNIKTPIQPGSSILKLIPVRPCPSTVDQDSWPRTGGGQGTKG